jgi:hypothetical protein
MEKMNQVGQFTHVVKLFNGFVIDHDKDRWINQVTVRQLNGHDEACLSQSQNIPSPLRTSSLLDRVLILSHVVSEKNDLTSAQISRMLTLGDRIKLLLEIRNMTFGENIECVVNCPKCDQNMSANILISTLTQPNGRLQPQEIKKEQYHFLKIDGFNLKIRSLTGADQESIAVVVLDNKANESNNNNYYRQVREKLVKSCIVSSEPSLNGHIIGDNLISTIASKLAELDPYADLIFDLKCPLCNYFFEIPFNAEDFILREIDIRSQYLENEVHLLAFYYHWTEDAILSLPIKRRKAYADLIKRTLSGEGF